MNKDATDIDLDEMTVDGRGPEGQSYPIRMFISYRRDDTRGSAGRIYDHLALRFGKSSVFKDIDTIEPGMPWDEAIDDAIGSCDLLLAVIGPQWLMAADARGQRRLEDPEDRHRRELETAMEQHRALIPVLVEGASMPREEELPGKLKRLSKYQAYIIGEPFKYGLQGLIEAIENVARRRAERAAAQRATAAGAAAEKAVIAEKATTAEGAAAEKATTADASEAAEDAAERAAAERAEEARKAAEARPPSLREAVDQADLRYRALPEGALAFSFRSDRAEDLVILAKELNDEIVLFSTRLPKPGVFGQEAALRNLLRTSFQANYSKVMASASLDLMAAAEIHPSMLTPGVAEGLVRGLACLGDLKGGDLKDTQIMNAAIRSSRAAQESYIVIDPDSARQAIRRMAEEGGLAVQESGAVIVFELPMPGVGGAQLKVLVNASRQVISLCAFLGLKAEGNKVQFMQQLLQLNREADVARVGFDADDEVAFLYEVPQVVPGLLEKVTTQFMLLSIGVASIAAGNLKR